MKIKSGKYGYGIKNIDKGYSCELAPVFCAQENQERVYVPAKQIKGVNCSVVVKKGEKVKIGSRLMVNGNNCITSPVSGVMEEILTELSCYGGKTEVVVIKNDYKNDQTTFPKNDISADKVTLLSNLKESYIVDYDGESAINKISAVINKEPVIVVNLATDEPYQKNTPFLISERLDDCVMAVRVIAKLLNSNNIVLATAKTREKVYSKFISAVESELGELFNFVKLVVPDRYPVGDETEIVKALTNKFYKTNEKSRENGFISFDLFTLYAIKMLTIDGVSLPSKPISIIEKEGDKITTTMMWATLGTPITSLVNGFKGENEKSVQKLVMGGFFRGFAVAGSFHGLDYRTKSIVLINDRLTEEPLELPCIRCGKCVKVCPRKLEPFKIEESVINGDYYDARTMGAEFCSRCGCCGFVCPSKRHIVQRICYAKEKILNEGED